MASTFFGLTIAYTGLQAAQTSINVTAHNLSNVNTDGYTKEQAQVQAGDALRTYSSYGTIGAGVIVKSISQIRDSYYDEKYRNNHANYGEYEAKNNYMSQIQDYLNEFVLKGCSEEYKNFFSAVNQLTLTPADESAKNQLVNNAKSMADYFNTLSTNLRNVQLDANNEVKDAVQQINSLAQNISALNKQINQIEANYGNSNDLRDQRNALLDKLSQIANITTSEQDLGNNLTSFSVYINGQPLIESYNYHSLQVVSRTEARNASDIEGLYDIQWETGQEFNIYSDSLGGQLKGLIDIRDGCNGEIESFAKNDDGSYKVDHDGNNTLETANYDGSNTSYKGIPYYQAQLNQFIQTFSEAVNDILKTGVSSDGKTEGISLFTVKDGSKPMTASNVTVNKELLDDPNKLATKSAVNTGEANDDIMEKLRDLQNAKIFDGGIGSYFLETIVSDMSIDANKAETFTANYLNLKTSIQNQRLSVMGVDVDEEAMDLMKFQQAYSLSSKMMSVMNQLYDKLINYTGV